MYSWSARDCKNSREHSEMTPLLPAARRVFFCYVHSVIMKGKKLMEKDLMKQREQVLLELIHDKAYIPMKAKEIAALLNIPRSQRDELKEVLDALVEEGKIGLSRRGKYGKPEEFALQGIFKRHGEGLRLCDGGRHGAGCIYPGGEEGTGLKR